MAYKYWRAVLRYGHVKKGKEVSVARYIQSEPEFGIVDVMNLVQNMPGVKNRGALRIERIDEAAFERGKLEEQDNFYLLKLMTYRPKNPIQETVGGAH
ncbi:hypothetical protein [Paenibacillus sp. NPDC058071]|uniref:hypothetical protein n=1 Tax=Paenibacillus sp. NPDC058071 TaxID=3346326 RepID=UPI0036D8B791